MYCDHCPPRILGYLKQCAGEVKVEKILSVTDPILEVSYTPNAPDFTIRHILASISTADPNLKASLHHPPTLEERSQKINAREQRRLLLRTALSVTVAVPTLLITIVFMSLVPSENHLRQFLPGYHPGGCATLVITICYRCVRHSLPLRYRSSRSNCPLCWWWPSRSKRDPCQRWRRSIPGSQWTRLRGFRQNWYLNTRR